MEASQIANTTAEIKIEHEYESTRNTWQSCFHKNYANAKKLNLFGSSTTQLVPTQSYITPNDYALSKVQVKATSM